MEIYDIHPIIVHLPIGASIFYLFTAAMLLVNRERWLHVHRVLGLFVIIGIILAIGSGLFVDSFLPHNEEIEAMMTTHADLAYWLAIPVALLVGLASVRIKKTRNGILIGTALVPLIAFTIIGHYGMQMTHRLGAGTEFMNRLIEQSGHSHGDGLDNSHSPPLLSREPPPDTSLHGSPRDTTAEVDMHDHTNESTHEHKHGE
jgi:uncharacterized membrane protein